MNKLKKHLFAAFSTIALSFYAVQAAADAKVMNPGEAVGQLVFLSEQDVKTESAKFKSLSPLSIPVFAELPLDMSVVAGAITLKQQNLLSHVQLKSRARHTPNLDISGLEGGMQNPLLAKYTDGAWVHMVLTAKGEIKIATSTEALALQFYQNKQSAPVVLKSDLSVKTIRPTEQMGSVDYVTVGSKAANYSELANLLNTASRTVVRNGYGIPFYYYQEFIDANPKVKAAIAAILRDPLMTKVAKVTYREAKLKALQDLMMSEETVINEQLVNDLLAIYEQLRGPDGLPRNMKMRSSTNSEDLPNFNGAGLYTSSSYKPTKKGVEKSLEAKKASLKEALRTVWSSVWNLRAFDERAYFRIPHAAVKMGIQVNPSFGKEAADGVVVTKNILGTSAPDETGVYIEVQRGDKHSVANPEAGVKPQKILVTFAKAQSLDVASYKIQVLENSNIADDGETILPQDNPNPVMKNEEILDLAWQTMKAQAHFGPLLDPENKDFALDLEFKVDQEDTGSRQIYIKQARPYID